jgi:hypothetical protein
MRHQRTTKIEIITGETNFSVWYQHKKNFPTYSTLDGIVVFELLL